MNTTANGTTAAKVNENKTQYDVIERVIRIEFEHDDRQTTDEAREYAAGLVVSHVIGHMHTIDNGVRLTDISDMGEPEPVPSRPTFDEAARDEVERHYNNGDSNDETAARIAYAISKAVANTYGKGNTARYILDTIAYYVHSHCNTVLNDEDGE